MIFSKLLGFLNNKNQNGLEERSKSILIIFLQRKNKLMIFKYFGIVNDIVYRGFIVRLYLLLMNYLDQQ